MSTATTIEWTEATWNPVSGCSKVSPGCAHCYAETVALRFWSTQYPPVEYDTYSVDNCCSVTEMRARQFTDVMCHEDRLTQPLRWMKPRKVFVNSMSDLFHEDVPDEFIDKVFAVMALVPQHTFQVLTKRPDRMLQWFENSGSDAVNVTMNYPQFLPANGRSYPRFVSRWPLQNVWIGVSVENQRFADERIPLLLQTPAAVRFISAEPLLGPIDLRGVLPDPLDGAAHTAGMDLPPLDWVIVGGESGKGARPFDLAWARSIVQQCQSVGVPVFVKQMGAAPIIDRVALVAGVFVPDYELRLRDRKGGAMAEWPEDLRVREFPQERPCR